MKPILTLAKVAAKAEEAEPALFPPFTGWMLWNAVRTQHISRSTAWPWHRDTIFEDLPADVQTAWNRAAADLQQRAKTYGRLV